MVPQIPPITPAPKTTAIKHLCEAEMQEHRKKWICYNCDEKFTQGHRCADKNIYLLDVASLPSPKICEATQDPVDDEVDIQQSLVDPPSYDDQYHPEIYLHALARVTTPQTM